MLPSATQPREAETAPAKRPFRRPPLAATLCMVLLGIYALFFAVHAAVSIVCPYLIEYGEGLYVYEAVRLAHGDALYQANAAAPFTAAIYSPLYYLMLALPAAIFGGAFWYGRLITIVATLACVLLVRRAAGDMGLNKYAALGTGLSILALPPLYDWGAISKGDNVGIAFAFGALVVAGRTVSRTSQRDVYIAAGLCLAALATRQTLFAAPLAIGLWLLLRDWRAGLRFGAAFVGGAALLVLLAQFVTGGEFLHHIVGYNAQKIEISRILDGYWYFVLATPVLAVCALIMVVRIGATRARRVGVAGLWACYALTAFAATVGVGKIGSFLNHFTEFLVAGMLLLWLAVASSKRRGLLWLMVLQLVMLHHIPFYADDNRTPPPSEFERGATITRVVEDYAKRTPVFASDVGWLLSSGVRTDLDDSFIFTQRAKSGAWEQAPFVAKLRNGEYGLLVVLSWPPDSLGHDETYIANGLVFNTNNITTQMADAIAGRYHLLARYGDTLLLVPN